MASLINKIIDSQRLISRVKHYAWTAGASEEAWGQMLDMLQSPLGQAVLALPQQQLDSLLVNDMYKIRMHNMYSQFMTGVCAEFALNIRSIKGGDGSSSAATVLSDMREHHPEIYSALMARVCQQLQQLHPLGASVVAALQEFHQGFVPPEALTARLAAAGVAPVTWVDLNGRLVAIGAGPIEAASNTETSCMQAVQAAVIAAAAAAASSSSSNSSDCKQQQQCVPTRPALLLLDRTERLANSLGKMVATVEQINNIGHGFNILLMAGRRSTDMLHLLLQNLYFMKHVKGYIGTSSVLACVLLREVLQSQGVSSQQRQQLVKGLLGTHAHEMTCITQQLMVGYDQDAGRRCGLKVPVCVSQLLAHLLFQVANGDQPPTALPDTFTTPYFVRLALMCTPPEEFVHDMRDKWGLAVEPDSRVFDLFRVWRMDSGDYPALAQLIIASWQQRSADRHAAGLQALPAPHLMHSNIDSVDDIRQLAALPEHLRPTTLGFGGLADGFMPFTTPEGNSTAAAAAAAMPRTAAAAAPAGTSSCSNSVSSASSIGLMVGPPQPAAVAAAANNPSNDSSTITLPVASLVMKAVQAYVDDSSISNVASSTVQDTIVTSSATDPNTADTVYPLASGRAAAAAADVGSSSSSSKWLGRLQECAVKLGDDSSLSKAQVDQRLPSGTQHEVLCRMTAMVQGAEQLKPEHAVALSEVLRQAYVAVVRDGLLRAGGARGGPRSLDQSLVAA